MTLSDWLDEITDHLIHSRISTEAEKEQLIQERAARHASEKFYEDVFARLNAIMAEARDAQKEGVLLLKTQRDELAILVEQIAAIA